MVRPTTHSAGPLLAALAAQAALWFWDLRLLPIWGDEQFTLNTVALGWPEVVRALAADIHPRCISLC